jgi:hypothetical protein
MLIDSETKSMNILTKSEASCDFIPGQLDVLFVAHTKTNGTGKSVTYGLLKPFGITDASQMCAAKDLPTGASSDNTFVRVTSVTGSCNTPITANHSVATYPNPNPKKDPTATLKCSDSLNLDNSDNTVNVNMPRVVADLCPSCSATHIDSYTDNQSCDVHPGGDNTVVDLGNFYTATTR